MISNLQYRPKNYCKAYSCSNESHCHLPVAATGDHTAKPLEEAKHGILSLFLMKSREGDADANNDNEITAGGLCGYVETNFIQQSSGLETTEL